MRKCKTCRQPFAPKYSSLQATCGKIECAVSHGKVLQLKQRKEVDKAFKKKVRDSDKSWHIKTLEKIFNKFIRIRDADKPCISCDTYTAKTNDYRVARAWQAGHYRSKGGFPELRFEELNVHKECLNCNCYDANHLESYRVNLIGRIGLEKVEALEGPHEPAKYTIPELQDMIKEYRAKVREMENITSN